MCRDLMLHHHTVTVNLHSYWSEVKHIDWHHTDRTRCQMFFKLPNSFNFFVCSDFWESGTFWICFVYLNCLKYLMSLFLPPHSHRCTFIWWKNSSAVNLFSSRRTYSSWKFLSCILTDWNCNKHQKLVFPYSSFFHHFYCSHKLRMCVCNWRWRLSAAPWCPSQTLSRMFACILCFLWMFVCKQTTITVIYSSGSLSVRRVCVCSWKI